MRALIRPAFPILACIVLGACATQPRPVSVNPCPPWPDYPADLHSNQGSPYLGCTNAENLKQMVEDKHDLKTGRKLGPANGARQSKAVKDYEDGKTKTSADSGGSTRGAILLPQINPQGTQ